MITALNVTTLIKVRLFWTKFTDFKLHFVMKNSAENHPLMLIRNYGLLKKLVENEIYYLFLLVYKEEIVNYESPVHFSSGSVKCIAMLIRFALFIYWLVICPCKSQNHL